MTANQPLLLYAFAQVRIDLPELLCLVSRGRSDSVTWCCKPLYGPLSTPMCNLLNLQDAWAFLFRYSDKLLRFFSTGRQQLNSRASLPLPA